MEKKIETEIKKAFTHGGIFHADDVFSAALLRMRNPHILIERGNQVPENYDGLVFDIGGGEFDHHQKDKRIRENGIPYAAFGLLWEKYGTCFLEEEDAKNFEKHFVEELDWADNTGESNLLAECIADRNPAWNDGEVDRNQKFSDAVVFAMEILKNRFHILSANREAYWKVREIAEKNKGPILIMEESMPWKKALKEIEIYYVIFPSLRGGYMIQAVPADREEEEEEKHNEVKLPFPEKWRGASAQSLQKLTKIDTFRFCHGGGYLCSADTLEDAKKVAEEAYKQKSNGE